MFSFSGSPPHVRGKGLLCSLFRSDAGITPAYAGKRAHGCTCERYSWDHPRVCGEKGCSACHAKEKPGSPPRMRGKGACNQAVCPDNGITPAYAGKRQIGQRAKLPPWDHPRVCGEKVVPLVWMTCDIGSPPRMRGKVITVERNQLPRGITPAYAGKSTVPDVAGIPAEDHPRVCGEKRSRW